MASTLDQPKYPVVFKWTFHTARHVYVSGSWDNWNKKWLLVKHDNYFATVLYLCPGNYEYKFVVDGVWMVDDSSVKIDNPLGGQNNLLSEQDFVQLDALDNDIQPPEGLMRIMNASGPAHAIPPEVLVFVLDRDIKRLENRIVSVDNRITSVEASLNTHITTVEASLDNRITTVEASLNNRITTVEASLKASMAAMETRLTNEIRDSKQDKKQVITWILAIIALIVSVGDKIYNTVGHNFAN